MLASFGGDARRTWQRLDWSTRRLYLSALQSDLFNRVVAARLEHFDQLLPGDLAMKHVNGAIFPVTNAEAEQPRCDAFEISPTGPLFVRKMREPAGEPAEIEAQLLDDAGLSPEVFRKTTAERMDGTRRPLRVRPVEASANAGRDTNGPNLLLEFSLPPGAYATTLLSEVCEGAKKREEGFGSP